MSDSEKRMYKFIHKVIKETLKTEIRASEDRIVERIISESNSKRNDRPIVEKTMTAAQRAIQHGMNIHNKIPTSADPKSNNVLADLINATSPLSEQGSVTGNMNGDVLTKPIETGNAALDSAVGAQFRDYSAFMKKVDERNETRKGN